MTKYTVTGDIGRFKMGQSIETPADVAAYYRTVANEGADNNTTLTDAQILLIVASVAGDDENTEVERIEMIEAGKVPAPALGQPVPAKSIGAAQKEADAKMLAMRADNNVTLAQHLAKVWETKAFLAYSAKYIMDDLVSIYGVEEMKKWPIIGAVSHTDGDKLKPTGHPNPNGYLRPTRRKGSSGSAMAYWSDAFSENLKAIRDLREQLAAAKESKTMGEIAKAQLESRLEQRVAAMKAKVMAGIELFQRLQECEGYLTPAHDEKGNPLFQDDGVTPRLIPVVKLEWEMERKPLIDDEGNPVMDGPKNPNRQRITTVPAEVEKPILLSDPTPGITDFKQLSIVQFCGLDFALARKNGLTLESLLATMKREPKALADAFKIADIEDYMAAINVMASVLEDKAWYVSISHEALKETDDVSEMLVSMRAVENKLHSMLAPYGKRIAEWIAKNDPDTEDAPKTGTAG